MTAPLRGVVVDRASAAAVNGGHSARVDQGELTRLRKEVAKLRMERDILEKAAAYFARESMCGSASWRSTEGRGPWG